MEWEQCLIDVRRGCCSIPDWFSLAIWSQCGKRTTVSARCEEPLHAALLGSFGLSTWQGVAQHYSTEAKSTTSNDELYICSLGPYAHLCNILTPLFMLWDGHLAFSTITERILKISWHQLMILSFNLILKVVEGMFIFLEDLYGLEKTVSTKHIPVMNKRHKVFPKLKCATQK